MQFSRIEKVSIVKLALQIAAADGKFVGEEKNMLILKAASLDVEPEEFVPILRESESLKSETALAMVTNMTPAQKRFVAAYLGTIVAVDGNVDDAETKLWSLISALCGLPAMDISEAIEIMANK